MYLRETLEKNANATALKAWARFRALFPDCGECPVIVINARLRTTAGRAWLAESKIDLSLKLLERFPAEFAWVIIPHELAHHVAYRLHGDAGHGKHWKNAMRAFGLEPDIYHSLEL